MGKKNIKLSINQPVIRTHVAKPALEGLAEESLTSTNMLSQLGGVSPACAWSLAPAPPCAYASAPPCA